MFTRLITLSLLAILSAMPAAYAADNGKQQEKIRSQMLAFVVNSEHGEETLKRASTAEPGNTLEYQLSYTNTTGEPMSALNVAVPVPANTRYLGKSANTRVPSQFEVSIDGGKNWEGEPVKRLRKDKNGQMNEVVVSASEYTNLRWLVQRPLKGGEVQQFKYRIEVI